MEEQHGIRRLPDDGLAPRPAGIRQGWWIQWRGGTRKLALALREEQWGVPPWGRDALRSVLSARVQVFAPAGITVRATHSVFVTRRGENLYLPEAESDRMVLRALSGAGERTRLELRVPAAGGLLHAALNLSSSPTRPVRAQWRLDWATHARLKRDR
jgi:hypothetical protein